MRYILAIVLPPIAVLTCGKPFQTIFNLVLTLMFWIPGMIHALFVVHNHHADRRADELLRVLRSPRIA